MTPCRTARAAVRRSPSMPVGVATAASPSAVGAQSRPALASGPPVSEGGRDLRVEVREVPARRRVLSAALALELVWLMLTAAVVVSLAAHLGSADEVGVDPASDRLLVYLVPPMTVVV